MTELSTTEAKQARILYLTLKGRWFDMIASDEKKEEYRGLTKYWLVRLKRNAKTSITQGEFKTFDFVHFARGGHFHESIPQMTVECLGIEVRTGRPEWGAEPDKRYFVIKLGKIISTKNILQSI